MDLVLILQLAKAVANELWKFRYLALTLGFLTATSLLLVGFFWQEKFESSATLYADQTNIITPLLQGQAQATTLQSRLQIVRDTLKSKEALEMVVREEGFLQGGETPAQLAGLADGLKRAVHVKSLDRNYIGVSYLDESPERAFRVVNRLVEIFIDASSENKRSESRQAFNFIDKQAESYKEQLRQAEQNLKQFNANNLDGTEGQALQNIEALQQSIEVIELDLEQATERAESLRQQVAQENRYLTEKAKADTYNERIVDAVEQLDELKLFYTDSHPDVIAMQEHIQVLKNAKASDIDVPVTSSASDIENPVFDELRSALATAKVEQAAIERKKESLDKRLLEGRDRLKRVVARKAELTELTRDYNVTKNLYEDLLARKERARLSMTLDIEGQGLNYKIQTPPAYPRAPSGLRLSDFVLLGVLFGCALPIGLAIAYVLFDPRIRFASNIQQDFDIPLLAEVPHFSSSLGARLNRLDARIFLFWAIVLSIVYVGLIVAAGLVK